MKYCIARPINGISLNGLEYLLDDYGEPYEFETREECLKVIKACVTEEEPEEYIWEKEDE